ncbi:MAG TPA: efflux RND transporter permease subunit [Terriglobales bacterium]|nr:efflux RND transporter permease subunit [Terriglobales bacterium]
MKISETFIERPIATTLVMAAILIFGIFSYTVLPVSDLPNVDFPTIQVNASVPGASPETMATAVATPLEKQFSTIAGVDNMTSVNALGSTSITLQFKLERDIDAAAQDVQAAIAKTVRELPADMPAPPSYQKVNPADQPVLFLALSSPTLKLSEVDEYAQSVLAQRISTVSGVAQVSVFGSQKYAVRTQLDPRALATRKIGIDEVSQAIRQGNVNLPTGTLFGSHRSYTILATGQLTKADEFRQLIVAYRNGAPVRLGEVGNVIDSVENDRVATWFVANRSIVLAVQRQPGTNTVEVVDNVKKQIEVLRTQIPASVNLDIMFDRSASIRDSVNEVKFTLILSIALVVMVIFLFLRNLSATLIPSLALPMSIVGTFSVMYLLGFSIDNLSLMALTLSVGFVVDDAIVMLENIVRHMEMGKPPFKAAMDGAREIGFTILSMTLSLAAVFIPVIFMGGIIGRLLNEFAITIGVAILVSGFVSLTLTPMLCSRFLRHNPREKHGPVYQLSEKFFDGMRNIYERSLRLVLLHKPATVVVSGVVLMLTFVLFSGVPGLVGNILPKSTPKIITEGIPKGFLPTEDIDSLRATTEAQQGVSFKEMVVKQQQVAAIIRAHPGVDVFFSTVGGGGGPNSGNTGRLFIRLKPRNQRAGAEQIIQELRPKLAQVTGISVFLQVPPSINLGGRQSKGLYQYTLQSPDTNELYAAAPLLEAKLKESPELQDVTSDLQINNPQVNVQIDRDKAAALGVTSFQIEDALYSAYGSRQVSTIYSPTNQYRVVMELQPEFQLDPNALSMLYIRSSKGELVPLNAVSTIQRNIGPLTVAHQGQTPAVTISFNLRPGVALSQATALVNEAARTTLPATVATSFQGTAQAFESSVKGLGLLLLMAILVIYIVLGILYESFIHPITILSGLPSAGVGALLTLLLFGYELNLYGFVGILLLVGIVKKNAIMMIDFALDAQRNDGKRAEDAIFEGALIRFRPIMMTTAAALMGTLPIALGFGAGAEARRPLGLAVVGGLILSQILTLYITPVFYIYLDRFQHWVSERGTSRATVESDDFALTGQEQHHD